MAHPLIDWRFSAAGVANPDGSAAAIINGLVPAPGPGATAMGDLASALTFAPGASCTSQLAPAALDATRFAIRVAFRVTSAVSGRRNLVESTALPFSLFIEPGAAADRFNVSASVENGSAGWSSASSANRRVLSVGQWYVASLVFDIDTMALLIDDRVVAVTAFPRGGMRAGSGDRLWVGTWIDGARWPFVGEIAGVQLWRDIPEALESLLDAERGSAEWHLMRKENEVRPILNLGPKTADFYYDPGTGSYIQPYALAVISYTEGHPAAFVMYGAILGKWRSDENLRRALGGLASDEIAGRRSGSRKSVFAQGAIYWSAQSGAFPVLGRMNIDFDLLGEGVSPIGLPIADAENVAGGKMQRFQSGRMYLQNGRPKAFEVHGAILAKYDAAGGLGRFGFPISDETDVRRGTAVIGKVSEFESASIYWSPQTPAAVIYGAIRERYRGRPGDTGEGGPQGDLGFPTSDESDIPGAPGARFNSFQNGSILWFGGPIFVCRPFRIFLGRLDTKEEDRDILDLDGQNDLYCRVCVDVNGHRVFDRKYPEGSTHYPSANIRDLNINVPHQIVPNNAGIAARVRVEVWESDDGNLFGGGDDHLGTLTSDLNIANAWGMRNNNGLFRSSNFGPWVNHLDWSVKPQVVAGTPLDFWGVQNAGTPTVDWREYGAAFGDVDPDFEIDFGIIDDGLKALYYEAVVKGLADGGNCFGMSLEAIYAWKGRSRLGAPLSRFRTWSQVVDDFNVKHIYQVGADPIWWIVGQFLSGNTHDPVQVFQDTWDAFNRGQQAVLCIAQNADFSGAPHCIMPIAWDRNVSPWRMTVFDPNFPNQRRTLTVDPDRNEFVYDGSSDGSRIYRGRAWSGGRMHYMPWSVLDHRQRTPVWDAIMLLLGGVLLIFGDSAGVDSLTDENGNRLEGSQAKNRDALRGKLVELSGMFGPGAVRGRLYAGRQERSSLLIPALRTAVERLALPANANVLRNSSVLRANLAVQPMLRLPVASDAPVGSLAGASLMDLARQDRTGFVRPTQPTDLDTIRAALSGKQNGRLESCYKRPLQSVRVAGDVRIGEKVGIAYERMAARNNEVVLSSDRERVYAVTLGSKLGAGKDFLKVTLEGPPALRNAPLRVNIQPGGGMIDVIAQNTPVNLKVQVQGVVGGKPVAANFVSDVQGGQRIVLPDLADPGRLKLGQIETLQGEARNFRTLKRQ